MLQTNIQPSFSFDWTLFFQIFFIVVLVGGALWHLQKFLQYIKYITLEFTPSTTHLYFSSPTYISRVKSSPQEMLLLGSFFNI
jgi:hypothetical protein